MTEEEIKRIEKKLTAIGENLYLEHVWTDIDKELVSKLLKEYKQLQETIDDLTYKLNLKDIKIYELNTKLDELNTILEGKSIQELGLSDLYIKNDN